MKKMKKSKVIKIIAFLLLLPIFWFLAVDLSWYVDSCKDCYFYRDVIKYRLFTIPIYTKEHIELSHIYVVSRDLGVTCKHANLDHLYKQRLWGLVYCYCPCINGISFMGWESNVNDSEVAGRLKLLMESDPELPQKFNQRVIIEHDMEYWHTLRKKVFLKNEDMI